jgi:pimeloyl-ACP methyl ester carboxylesterase
MPSLHHAIVRRDAETTEHATFVLHGILGTGANLRGLAQGLLKHAPAGRAFVLVDLRMHGRSQYFVAPHDLEACARDLSHLQQSLGWPVREVIGHSFGGKVALTFAAAHGDLERLAMLDSAPGARTTRRGSEDTLRVLEMLEALPRTFARREDFVAEVEARGFSRMLGEWLAMNLVRTEDVFRMRLDLSAIHALIDDYFVQDLWPALEQLSCRTDLVIGGRSTVFDPTERARASALAASSGGRVRVHVIEEAGHWLHVDAPDALLQALLG